MAVPLVLLVLPASLVLHTTRPAYAHYLRSPVHRVHHAPSGLLCVLYVPVCPRMSSYAICPQPGTENAQYAEKRHEVAKCQRFGAVNRP